jgi:hypothetical protein
LRFALFKKHTSATIVFVNAKLVLGCSSKANGEQCASPGGGPAKGTKGNLKLRKKPKTKPAPEAPDIAPD